MPSNTTASLATEIPSLPYSITVDPDNAAQDLWWKYTAQDGEIAIGLFAWADDAGAYRPTLQVWRGDNPVSIDTDTPLAGNKAQRKPCVLPVTPGDTYYIKIEDANATNPLGASLYFSALPAPATPAEEGDYFIPDDTGGADDNTGWFPASITDPATGVVRRYAIFPAGEAADNVPTGEMLAANWNSTDGNHLALYDYQFELIATVLGIEGGLIRGDGQSTFFVYDPGPDTVSTVSKAGVVGGTTWIIGGAITICPNRAHTWLYYASSTLAGGSLKRWDLVNDVDLGAMTGTVIAGYGISKDVLVLADDTILVPYGKGTATVDYLVRRYAADGSGTVLNTYNFGTVPIDRMNVAPDRASFVVYHHVSSGLSRFTHIRASDGVVLNTFDAYQCNAGFMQAPATLGAPRFGHSQSCPFLVLQRDEQTVIAVDESVPCCPCDCPPPSPGPTGSPSSSPIPTHTGPILPPVNVLPESGGPTPIDPSYWDRLCAGAGTVPTAADPTDAENWVRA